MNEAGDLPLSPVKAAGGTLLTFPEGLNNITHWHMYSPHVFSHFETDDSRVLMKLFSKTV